MSAAAQRLRALLDTGRTRIAPVAHDALTARMIERAGFELYGIGGLGVAAFRHATDDGALRVEQMLAASRDILAGAHLPALVDAESGYGGGEALTRAVLGFRAAGAAALVIDDRAMRGVLPAASPLATLEEAVSRIRAAAAARGADPMLIVARTAALPALGLEPTLQRARALRQAGADVLFVDTQETLAEVGAVARGLAALAPLMICITGQRAAPDLTLPALESLGVAVVLTPLQVMTRIIDSIHDSLSELQRGEFQSAHPLRPVLGQILKREAP